MKLDLKQIWLCGIIMILMFLILLYSMNCTSDFYHFKENGEETSKDTEYFLDQLGCYEIISRYLIHYLLSTKVAVTFYLSFRNEFQPFLATNQGSDWLTQHVNQLEAWFFVGNG